MYHEEVYDEDFDLHHSIAIIVQIIQGFNIENKMIAAICVAPVVLARAGILEDKIVTAYPAKRNSKRK